MVRSQFEVSFQPVKRWVSMEFAESNDGINVTTADAAKGMATEAGKFTLN